MSVLLMLRSGARRLGLFATVALASFALALVGTACSENTAGVLGESGGAADSTLAAADTSAMPGPVDSTFSVPSDTTNSSPPDSSSGAAPSDSASEGLPVPGEDGSLPVVEANASFAGIVYGTTSLDASLLNSVHTGTLRGGGVTEKSIGGLLADVRGKGGRIVLKLCNGSDSFIKNGDGTFSLTKWKALVSRFKSSNLGPYINDGTILGHYLIDEPQQAQRWGGKAISPATLESMAQYSKSLWPTMPTLVRTLPSWLASSSTTYRYLDAGWAQYRSGKGNINTYIATEVAAAKKKGLGLVVGLNVLDGGNGTSRIPGYTRGKFAMSASEIRTYGTALLNQSYVCGFYSWTYDSKYYGRSDVRSAMADMSAKARAHQRTSCRQ